MILSASNNHLLKHGNRRCPNHLSHILPLQFHTMMNLTQEEKIPCWWYGSTTTHHMHLLCDLDYNLKCNKMWDLSSTILTMSYEWTSQSLTPLIQKCSKNTEQCIGEVVPWQVKYLRYFPWICYTKKTLNKSPFVMRHTLKVNIEDCY